MASIRKIWTVLFLGVVFCAKGTPAQTMPQASGDALHAMTELAGVIFAGQVIAVRQHGGSNGAAGVVEIDFAVKDAVRGVSGGSYTLREWAGLWPGGNEPFRVGQEYLMLLHTPSAAGLSSPVGGMDGAIPIRGGEIAEGLVVDMSWVATRVVTPTAYLQTQSQGPVGGPINIHAEALSASSFATAKVAGVVAPIEQISDSAHQGMAYPAVLGLLRSWEAGSHGAR